MQWVVIIESQDRLTNFGFCKRCLKSWYLWLRTKNNLCFFSVFSSKHCYVFIHVERHSKHCFVNYVENILRQKGNHKIHANKNTNILLVSRNRYQYFRHIYKNPTIPENVMGFNNHKSRHKLFNGWALCSKGFFENSFFLQLNNFDFHIFCFYSIYFLTLVYFFF